MTRFLRVRPVRLGVTILTIAAAIGGLTLGSAMASRSARSSALPCRTGGPGCMHIGFTDAWFGGKTVQLEYSHGYFCAEPPESDASSHCEAGTAAKTPPPSGPVVSSIYLLVPKGFTPPSSTVMCWMRCIDQPRTIDLSRIGGGKNAVLSPRSFVIEDAESFQSTWWPVVVVGVKNLRAWNQIAAAKTIDSVDACQASGNCAQEAETNGFLFFQVLGPGMSPQGPA
jgi:hypothetical protein